MRVFALLLVWWKLYEAVLLYLTGQERCWPALNSHLSSALKKEGYVQKNDLPLYLLYVTAYLATNVCSLVFTPSSEVIQEHPILIRWRLNFNGGEKKKRNKKYSNVIKQCKQLMGLKYLPKPPFYRMMLFWIWTKFRF